MMRLLLPLILTVAAVPGIAADHSGHQGHAMPQAAPTAGTVQLAEGTIKKMDKAAGKVTLAHGPIENIGMGAMTMAFKVKEPKQLDAFKVGDKVRFQAIMADGDIVVTRIEAAK